MKKFLCLVMVFILCVSMFATAEENAGEETVSNIVTYGPLTFDTFGEWMAERHSIDADYLCDTFVSTDDPYCFIGVIVQDVWNVMMPEESRLKLEAKGVTQDDYNNIEMARAHLIDRVNILGANPEDVEILEVGNYPYAHIVAPDEVVYGNEVVVYDASMYYTIIKGYLIEFILMAPEESRYHDSFINILSTLSIDVIDSLTEN